MIPHHLFGEASPATRAAALTLLDEISVPLDIPTIERAFQTAGLSRSQARAALGVLKGLRVIALVPE